MLFEPIFDVQGDEGARIKVIGVGGGGGNALNHMVRSFDPNSLGSDSMGSIEFFSVNTDAQALRTSEVTNTVQIGANVTKGLGAGGDPNKAHQAAEEDRDALANMIDGANMVFIAAGMGGGTGTGAAPVVAQISKEKGALTVAIVTKPFYFEQTKRCRYAEQGIQELSKHVDSLIIIENDKLLTVLPKNVTYEAAFAEANNVLRNSVIGISSMIISNGLVNVDFNDVREVMSGMGRALMGTGIAEGENRAEEAAKMAVASPLLEDTDLRGAKGVLVNIVSGRDLGLHEVRIIMDCVTENIDKNSATVIYGSAFDDSMEGKIRVTLVATGIGQPEELQPQKMNPIGSGYGQVGNHHGNGYMQTQQVNTRPLSQQPVQTLEQNSLGGYRQPEQFGSTQQAMPQGHVPTTPTGLGGNVFTPSSSIIPDFMKRHNNG